MNIYELAVIVSATDRATETLNKVGGAIGKVSAASQKMVAFGEKASVQGALMQGAADKIHSVLDSISEPADNVEDALAKVATVAQPLNGTLGAALSSIKKEALDWQNAHLLAADSFVDTTYNMISAGLNNKAAIEGTKVAYQVATATFGESAQAAALVATLYNNMGNKSADLTTEMTRLGDIVTKTQQTFQFENLNQLNEGLKYGTPVALQYGISLAELSTVIGQLNSAGVVGGQAGTSFAATMRSMNKASRDLGFEIARTADGSVNFIGTVANIEKKFGSLKQLTPEVQEAMQTAFGAEGYMGLSLMIGKSGELAANLDKVQNSAGAAAEATAKIEGTRRNGLKILAQNFDSLKISIADGLAPAVQTAGPKIIAMIRKVEAFAKENPKLVRTIVIAMAVSAAILSIVAPILMTVGAFSMFAGHALNAITVIGKAGWWLLKTLVPIFFKLTVAAVKFAMVLLANPITWIVLAIVAAAYLIYKNWAPISAFFSKLWDGITGGFNRAWSALKVMFADGFVTGMSRLIKLPKQLITQALVVAGGLIRDGFVAAWEAVKAGALAVVAAVPRAVDAVVAGFWTAVEWIKGAFRSLLEAIPQIIGALVGFVLSGLAGFLDTVANVWAALPGIIEGVVTLLWTVLREWTPLGFFIDSLSAVSSWLFGFSLVEAGQNILTTLWQGMKNMAGKPVELMRSVAQNIRNLLPFSPAKDGPLRDLHRVKLVETIADAVNPVPLQNAMRGALVAATLVGPVPISVEPLPTVPQVVQSPGGGGLGAGNMTVNINIGGNADAGTVSQLRELFNDPRARRALYELVSEQKRIDQRGAF